MVAPQSGGLGVRRTNGLHGKGKKFCRWFRVSPECRKWLDRAYNSGAVVIAANGRRVPVLALTPYARHLRNLKLIRPPIISAPPALQAAEASDLAPGCGPLPSAHRGSQEYRLNDPSRRGDVADTTEATAPSPGGRE
jgi:hypothetical protein